MASTDSPERYHHGDLRNALEAAALELIAESGPQALSLAEASRRAGVSVAAPFRHFRNKEALLAALVLRSFEAQRDRFGEAIARHRDPVEGLAAFAATYVEFSHTDRALFDVAFGAGISKSDHPGLEEAGQAVLDVLLSPAEALRPHAPDAAMELVHAVAAASHGYAVFLREGVFGDAGKAVESTAAQAARVARAIARG